VLETRIMKQAVDIAEKFGVASRRTIPAPFPKVPAFLEERTEITLWVRKPSRSVVPPATGGNVVSNSRECEGEIDQQVYIDYGKNVRASWNEIDAVE